MEEDIKILEEFINFLNKNGDYVVDENLRDEKIALEHLVQAYKYQKKIINDTYREANNVLYFDDNSDYCCALWEILRIINPDLEEYPDLDYIEESEE